MGVLFTNIAIIDGGGDQPFSGEILVVGERIAKVARSGGVPRDGHDVIDGGGAT